MQPPSQSMAESPTYFNDTNRAGATNPCEPYEYLMVTEMRGRFGNRMSEYASLLAISSMTGYTPRIPQVR